MTATRTRREPVTKPAVRPADAAATRPGRDPADYLDHLTLGCKEGWAAYVHAPPPEPPERMTLCALHKLSSDATDEYNERRDVWHANIGTIHTAKVDAAIRQLRLFVRSNRQRYGLKPALALTGFPGLGKTELVNAFAKSFHLEQIRRYGPTTASGSERWPVCRVGMTGLTGVKEFNWAFLNFYAHPGAGTTTQFRVQAQELVRECETRVLIIDDLHFLQNRYPTVADLSNQFKHIADNFHLTMIFVGIGLNQRSALLDSTGDYKSRETDQLLRMTAPVRLTRYTRTKDWQNLLLTIEQRLVLAKNSPGMLVEDLSDYLLRRSTGHIGSLMTLLRLGCVYAIDNGTERITKRLLDTIDIDSAADLARKQLVAVG